MDAMGQPSARSISALAGGRRLLAVLLLLLVMCSMHPAHAWGGGSGSGGGIGTKTNRKDPRLVFKKPGSTLQVVPGQQFTVSIRVKKARLRQPALFQVVLPDGALFVGPTGHQPKQTTKKGDNKGRTPAPTAETAWKAKRAAAKRFPPPDTVVNGTAGERTLQWHLDTFPPRFNPIKLTFEVDFCGAPSPLAIRLNWQQGGRSARPVVITVSLGFEVVGLMVGDPARRQSKVGIVTINIHMIAAAHSHKWLAPHL